METLCGIDKGHDVSYRLVPALEVCTTTSKMYALVIWLPSFALFLAQYQLVL